MAEFFPDIPRIAYEGRKSKNPLAFKYYNPNEVVAGQTMREQLRFSQAYWHSLTGAGSDPFGAGTMQRPWDRYTGLDLAKARAEGAFELLTKLGIPFFCCHDRDIAPEGETLTVTNRNLDRMVDFIRPLMAATGVELLWGTANLFTHPRYVHGAATSPEAGVFAYAAAQVKKAMEITQSLGGRNYVFWGGREGYETLLNTDMKLELDNLARFLHLAVDYAREIGFTGQFLIEPKPKEPTRHQYDFDAATVLGFLEQYGLKPYFKLNIEANHATLAGHSFQHELRLARINDALGSIDANQGDPLLGWDTDQFPTDIYTTTLAMYEVLRNGGLHRGGLNFDAKVRRGSFEPVDLVHAHIAGMDAFARGLQVAARLIEDGVWEDLLARRYASYRTGIGLDIVDGKAGFRELESYALAAGETGIPSGRQERLEAVLNQYLLETE